MREVAVFQVVLRQGGVWQLVNVARDLKTERDMSKGEGKGWAKGWGMGNGEVGMWWLGLMA